MTGPRAGRNQELVLRLQNLSLYDLFLVGYDSGWNNHSISVFMCRYKIGRKFRIHNVADGFLIVRTK